MTLSQTCIDIKPQLSVVIVTTNHLVAYLFLEKILFSVFQDSAQLVPTDVELLF